VGELKGSWDKETTPPRRPPRGIDRYIRRTTYWHQLHRNRYVTPGGGTCTAESSTLKEDHWGTPPVVPSHSIKVDANVDSLVDGLQIANRYFHSRCSRCWYGRRPWNGIGWPPVCRRVRGRGVLNVGGRPGGVTKPRGVTQRRANLGGLGCIILDGIRLSSVRLRGGPGGSRGTSGHIGTTVLIRRWVHLSLRQRSGLPLWRRVDNP
jgi:hypothetical protein